MKINQTIIFVVVCTGGFFAGFTARLIRPNRSQSNPASDNQPAVNSSPAVPANGQAAAKPVAGDAADSPIRSTDTLETVLSVGNEIAYGRLALWMLDASEQDIATYWQNYRQCGQSNNDIADLIFIHWTRLNPKSAIAAATGSRNEEHAWWAWACHDPGAALAAAIDQHSPRLPNVAWGIGEFHHDWLRAHFGMIPQSGQANAILGFLKRENGPDLLGDLNFLKVHHYSNSGVFKLLIHKDPWTAYEWFKQNGDKNHEDTFVDTLRTTRPDVLEQIARQPATSGELARKIDAALFANVLETDPETAIEQAKTTKDPEIAARRLTSVGLILVATDPDRAFGLAQHMFTVNPEALFDPTSKDWDAQSSGPRPCDKETMQFMNALLAHDPERVMALATPEQPENFSALCGIWAKWDVSDYADWVSRQNDPDVREPAMSTVIDELRSEGQFEEAAEWTMSLDNPSDHLADLLWSWKQSNPTAADSWLAAANLPESDKQELQQDPLQRQSDRGED